MKKIILTIITVCSLIGPCFAQDACLTALLNSLKSSNQKEFKKIARTGYKYPHNDLISRRQYPHCYDLGPIITSFDVLDANVKKFLDGNATCKGLDVVKKQEILAEFKKEEESVLATPADEKFSENYVDESNEVVVIDRDFTGIARLPISDVNPNEFSYVLSSMSPLVINNKYFNAIKPAEDLTCWDYIHAITRIGRNSGTVFYDMRCGIETGLTQCSALPGQKVFIQHCDNGTEGDCAFVPISELENGKHEIFSDLFTSTSRPVQSSHKTYIRDVNWWDDDKTFYSLITESGLYYLWNRDLYGNGSPILIKGTKLIIGGVRVSRQAP